MPQGKGPSPDRATPGVARPTPRQALGRKGEDLAAALLTERGCRLVDRNYRCALGELDVVAWDGDTLVFVEVKTRRSSLFGTSAEAVSRSKQARLLRLADWYLQDHRLGQPPCRFDVVAVDARQDPPFLEWFRDAFSA
ncbi:MAG: YraN family protein [Bacillota bacterium]